MAITRRAKSNNVDAFIQAAPDAAPKLRGRKKVVTVTLPPDIVERFDAEAAKQERSRASMLAIVMREWVERRGG